MSKKQKYLVTGGTGFIGSALVKSLLKAGHRVRVLDNQTRGRKDRLSDVAADIELSDGDIRDPAAVDRATKGVDCVCHLAYINGTEFFYTIPDVILDVAVRGMMNVLDACIKNGVGELALASSSEVYQTPPRVPTDESAPLCVPDPLNARYSYGGGKIISELLAINFGRKHFQRVVIFRPHNVYGPDMGWEHVIPQFVLRMKEACSVAGDPVQFPIQGTGRETRSFIHIDDFSDGLMTVLDRGAHLGIYHIGTMEEVTMEKLARMVGEYFGRRIEIVPGEAAKGGTLRRCPDISKLRALGFEPKITLAEGLRVTAKWYDENSSKKPKR